MEKIDFDINPDKDDSNLYIFMKVIHRDLKPPRANCLKIANNNLNKKYVEQQSISLAEAGVRTLVEQGIISE